MTNHFNSVIQCQHCGKLTTAETGFLRWMRSNQRLDSAKGIIRTDADQIILRYKTWQNGRDHQDLMIVEVKEFGAEPESKHRDVFRFFNRLCNETQSKSEITGQKVEIFYRGYHLLQFEKTGPHDSSWIKWDRKVIDAETLTDLLAIERDPNNPSEFIHPFEQTT